MQFQMKPLKVEAIQFDGSNVVEIEEWAARVAFGNAKAGVRTIGNVVETVVRVGNPSGTTLAKVTDWIVMGLEGHLKVYPDVEFQKSFMLVIA